MIMYELVLLCVDTLPVPSNSTDKPRNANCSREHPMTLFLNTRLVPCFLAPTGPPCRNYLLA